MFNSIIKFNTFERDKWVRETISKLPLGLKILDVAAGTCPYRHLFISHDYKAQDFLQLEDHQHRDSASYGKIDYVCDSTKIPVQDNVFDVVLCTEALEHVPDPSKVVAEMARVAKDGALIIITAPLGSGLHQEPYHFYGGFTPHWYNLVMAAHGMCEITVIPNGGFFKHFGQECLRFVKLTAPWNFYGNLLINMIMAPIWVIMVLPIGSILPFLCHLLDRLDHSKEFTVGYFVTARKKRVPKADCNLDDISRPSLS